MDEAKLGNVNTVNKMKRTPYVGSMTLTLGSAGTTVTHIVTHNIGKIAFYMVGANINDTDVIWSSNRVFEYTQTSLSGYDLPVQLSYGIKENSLVIRLRNGDGSLAQSGTRKVYWVIYEDYLDA